MRSSGTWPTPGGDRRARVAPTAARAPATATVPAVRGRVPAIDLGQLALPVAGDAARRRRSRRRARSATRRRSAGRPRSPSAPTPSSARATCLAGRAPSRSRRSKQHLAPDHQPRELARGRCRACARCRRCGRRAGRVARSATAITSSSLCVTKMTDLALAGHPPQRGEQPLGLLRGEHRGRLVEDQHARVAVERLEDLHALLLADRELPGARAGVDVEAVALGELARPARSIAPRSSRTRAAPARSRARRSRRR